MAREIVLDTETTGLDPRSGHRLIEIACVELDDLIPTGRIFHRYVDPERDIDLEAERVHGISPAFLAGKPRFADAEVVDAFLEFVGDATLVAHNAAFDRDFVNAELGAPAAPLLPRTAGSTPWPWPRSASRACTTRSTRSASASRSRWPSGRSTARWSTPSCWPASIWSCSGGRERGLDLAQVGRGRRRTGRDRRRATMARAPGRWRRALTDAERAAHAAFVRDALKDDGGLAAVRASSA